MTAAPATEPFVFQPGTSPGSASGTDRLVDQTRREIAEIVREVALAARSQQTREAFLRLLVDRILRAMAAEGVLVWQRDATTSALTCVRRMGRVTDESIAPESLATHARLLIEVAAEGQPVVVPATPGAADAQVAANPTHLPVAIVPVEGEESDRPAEFLLEVFLEPECGIATQRGYLRFVAQMADLAGEFLRADQLRQMQHHRRMTLQVDAVIAQLHASLSCQKVETQLVDEVATRFGFDRVGLCMMVDGSPKLLAVSHVNQVDPISPAARELTSLAACELDQGDCRWWDSEEVDKAGSELVPRVVVGSSVPCHLRTPYQFRIVGMQLPAAGPVSQTSESELKRLMHHAGLAVANARRFEAIPGARLLSALSPSTLGDASRRRLIIPIAVAVVLIGAALFPIPLTVSSTALIRPAAVETFSTPRDCVVQEVHVTHGQKVVAGQPLITLTDQSLEEEITTLLGNRAVLLQKRTRLMSELVDTTSTRLDQFEQVQGEEQLVSEQIRALEEQLAVLGRVKESLVIRATQSGVIDAWQIGTRLGSRPLRRGDLLVHLIPEKTPWVVDARVPQSRVAHVQNANERGILAARVVLEAMPTTSFQAQLTRIGPTISDQEDAKPRMAMLLDLVGDPSHSHRDAFESPSLQHQAGAPARVMFHCGKASAGYVVLQDLIGTVWRTWGLYATGNTTRRADGKTIRSGEDR